MFRQFFVTLFLILYLNVLGLTVLELLLEDKRTDEEKENGGRINRRTIGNTDGVIWTQGPRKIQTSKKGRNLGIGSHKGNKKWGNPWIPLTYPNALHRQLISEIRSQSTADVGHSTCKLCQCNDVQSTEQELSLCRNVGLITCIKDNRVRQFGQTSKWLPSKKKSAAQATNIALVSPHIQMTKC
jgi:hypothetical protein